MRVMVNASVEGLDAQPQAQEASVAPGAAQEVFWPITVPANATGLAWTIEAIEKIAGTSRSDAKGGATDAMKAKQTVVPAISLTVQQATLVQLDKLFTLQVAAPADAIADGV